MSWIEPWKKCSPSMTRMQEGATQNLKIKLEISKPQYDKVLAKIYIIHHLYQWFLTFLSRDPNLRNIFMSRPKKKDNFFRSYLSNFPPFFFLQKWSFFNSHIKQFFNNKDKITFRSKQNLMKKHVLLMFLLLILYWKN